MATGQIQQVESVGKSHTCQDGASKLKMPSVSKHVVVKFKGVTKSGKRFRSQITVDGKGQYLGVFDTLKEAAEAYDRASIKAGRPPSRLNFPDQVPKNYKPKKRVRNDSESGHIGVAILRVKNGFRFKAQIAIDGETQYLGTFSTAKDAAKAYDRAASKVGRAPNFADDDDDSSGGESESAYEGEGFVISSYDTPPPSKKRKVVAFSITYKGVTKESDGKYHAQFSSPGGKQIYVGSFSSPMLAAVMRDRAAIAAGCAKSVLNFEDSSDSSDASDASDSDDDEIWL